MVVNMENVERLRALTASGEEAREALGLRERSEVTAEQESETHFEEVTSAMRGALRGVQNAPFGVGSPMPRLEDFRREGAGQPLAMRDVPQAGGEGTAGERGKGDRKRKRAE